MAPHSTISHYINESEIPSDHRTQIEKLRNALGSELLEEAWFFNDDFSLLRWLYGWDFKIGLFFFLRQIMFHFARGASIDKKELLFLSSLFLQLKFFLVSNNLLAL